MAKLSIQVDALNLDRIQEVFQVIKKVAEDNRVPAEVRQEIKDSIFNILESHYNA